MLIETLKLWEGREDVELTTFVTPKEPFMPEDCPRPAVIVCPGGAYATCDRHGREGDSVAMAFAMYGYQVFVLEYSVTSRAPEGSTVHPAMMIDYGKAVMVIREHAGEWNVDIDKISILGFSAGGHLCATVAVRWNDGTLSKAFNAPAQYFRPLCAMLIYLVTDFLVQKQMRTEKESAGMTTVNMDIAYFGQQDNDEDTLKAGSPCFHVTKDCPPVFLAAAQNDRLVDCTNTLNMAAALQKAGISYELHLFQYGDHGFALGNHLTEPWRWDKNYTAAAWLPLARTFLLHQHNPETAEFEKNPFAGMDF